MDFLRNHAHLAGGDTRKAPKNTLFSKSRHTPEGKGPPYDNPSKSTKSRRSLSITAYHGVPSQSFLIQIPIGLM